MKIKSMILLGSSFFTALFAQQSLNLSIYSGASAMYPIVNKLEEQSNGLIMERKLAPTFGIGAQHFIRKGQVGIEYGLDYYQINGNQKETFFATDIISLNQNQFDTEIERRATYLSIPLIFNYYFKKFIVSFGGFGATRISNSMKVTCLKNNSLRSFTQYGNNLSNYDAGVKFQFSYLISKKWAINLNYTHGFLDIGKDSEKGGKYYQFGIAEMTNRKLQTRQTTLGFQYCIFR